MFVQSGAIAAVLPTPTLGLLLDASGLPATTVPASTRKMDKDYTGYCMRVIRQDNNASADIPFDSNGFVKMTGTGSITAHCGSSPGFVSIMYAQDGTTNHLYQNNIANMYRIYNGTNVDTITSPLGNVIPALYAPDQNRGMVTNSFTRLQTSKATAVLVGAFASGTTTNSPRYISLLPTTTTLGDTSEVGAAMIARNTTLEQWGLNRASGWRATYAGTFGQLQQVCATIDGTSHMMAVDGQEVQATFSSAVALDVSRVGVGHTGFQPQSVGGSYIVEILVFPTALTTAQKQLIAANQRTAFGMNLGPEPTPPEDPGDPGTPAILNWTGMGYVTKYFDDFKTGYDYVYDSSHTYHSTVNKTEWLIYGDVNGTVKGNEGRGFRKVSQLTVDPTGSGRMLITAIGDFSSGVFKRNGPNNTDQKYGGWEVRFKLPPGYGYGPAILLWCKSNNWPTDGEDDIVEIPKGTKDNKLHTTLHIGSGNRQKPKTLVGDWTKWHTVSHTWTPTEYVYWMDGVEYFRTNDLSFQFPGQMWLGIQYDVGGYDANGQAGWIAVRDSTTPQPSVMEIDYVRILAKA